MLTKLGAWTLRSSGVNEYMVSKLQEARTKACSPPLLLLLLLLLLWDVSGSEVERLEVEGWGDGIIDTESMRICCPHKNTRAAFSDFSTLRPCFKKAFSGAAFFKIHVDDWPKQCNTCEFTLKSISVWTGPFFCHFYTRQWPANLAVLFAARSTDLDRSRYIGGQPIWCLGGYTFCHLHCYVNPSCWPSGNCMRWVEVLMMLTVVWPRAGEF